jgi:hypothetical protein
MYRAAYRAYCELLTPITMITTSIGIISSIDTVNKDLDKKKTIPQNFKILEPYLTIMGRGTIGFCIGILYPISLPICATYVIFGNNDKDNDKGQ